MSRIRVGFIADAAETRERAAAALGERFEVLPVTPVEARALDTSERAARGVAGEGSVTDVDCIVVGHDDAGTDVLSLLRDLREHHPDLPLVLFTGAWSESLASEAFRAGADDYVRRTGDGDGWTVLRNRIEHTVRERQTASQLIESERTVSTLVNNLPGVVYRVMPGGEVGFVGGNVASLTGHSAEAFKQREVHWWDVVAPADRERARAAIDAALAAREPFEVTYRIGPDGDRWVTDRGRGVFVDGDLTAVEGVLTDVTRRQRRDQQVRDLHAATRKLVAADTREAIAAVTAEAASEVLEYPINGVRLIDRSGEWLVPAAVPDVTEAVLGDRPDYAVDGESPAAQAFRRGEPVVITNAASISDGRDRGDLRSGMYLPLGDQGTLSIGATDRDAFDDDDRRLAELLADNAGAALAAIARREALENERDRLAALFENIPEPTVRVTVDDGKPYAREVNPAFEETFGVTAATIRDQPVDEFIVPEDEQDEAAAFNSRIRAGEPFHDEVQRLADDGPRDFILHVVPRELDADTTEGFAIYMDITERKARERDLERQNEQLEAFASVLSHDLRNPLNVASGRLANYRETGDPDDLDSVAAAHERIRDRIEDLLELARQGRTVDDPGRVELAATARAAWGAVDTADATLSVEPDMAIRADRPRLGRLFENLFANSVEHGASGNEPVSEDDPADSRAADGGADSLAVTVGETADGFFVADDGVGIPDSVRDDLFESGVTTAGGTGYGLAIVRSIAEAHGWTVRAVESEAGGARFEFSGVERVD